MLEFKIQSKNDANLTTLFLPSKVLRAKPKLNLPLFVPTSLKKPQERVRNREKSGMKIRKVGGHATARGKGDSRPLRLGTGH